MMRLSALVLLFPSLAFAETCGTWSADMEEGEGGRLKTASVCRDDGGRRSDLFLQCGGEGLLSLRFLMAETADFPPGGDPAFSTPLRLTVDGAPFDRPARYEAMDGAMVSDFPLDARLVEALKAGSAVTLAYPATTLSPAVFPLKGSRVALDWLTGACRQP